MGASYAFVPAAFAGGFPGHAAAALAMCLVAASYRDLRDVCGQWLALLGATLALGGLALGVAVMLTGHVPTAAHPAPGFTALVAAVALVVAERFATADRMRRWAQTATSARSLGVDLRVRVGDRTAVLRGLLDTGNRLRDPITGRPVVIVSPAALMGLVPEDARDAFALAASVSDAACATENHEAPCRSRRFEWPTDGVVNWMSRVQVVPYAGIGGSGVLTAVRPDSVYEVTIAGERPIGHVLLGLSPTPLAPGVDAVVPPTAWTRVGVGRGRSWKATDDAEFVTMGA